MSVFRLWNSFLLRRFHSHKANDTVSSFLHMLHTNPPPPITAFGEIRKAMHFHDDMIAKGFQFNQVTYGVLINGLCKAGETSAALQLLRRIEEERAVQPDVVMYTSIIERLCEKKFVSDAYDLYDEMLQRRISPDGVTYKALINGFCVVGELRKAVDLLNVMEMENIKPDVHTFVPLVDALCKEEKVEQANSVVVVMIKASVEPNVVIYNILLDTYWLIDQMNKARFLFNIMVTRGVSPDIHTYNIMISELCVLRLVNESLNNA